MHICQIYKKENYWPVSILSISLLSNFKYSKEVCLSKCQVFLLIFFSRYQHGFRKGFSTQQCLLALLEKWNRSIDRGKLSAALLTDLSKTFDYLNHDLLIAKFNAYGFSLPALRLIHDYLLNRK